MVFCPQVGQGIAEQRSLFSGNEREMIVYTIHCAQCAVLIQRAIVHVCKEGLGQAMLVQLA